jgi:hypothetical protein
VLLQYNVPEELAGAVMSMYDGAKAKVKYSNDQFTNFIDLGIGVLQGDTLAAYSFMIAINYAIRVALADQSLGLKITNKVGTSSRIKIPAKYITDLDFADDVMLVSGDTINSQKQLQLGRKLGVSHRIARFC